MAKNTILINDFRAGELTPDMDARVDLKDYYRGCRILENAMPIIEGGVARVPGTYYVRPVKTDEGWCLRVTKSGTGTGIVTSDLVPGINCGSDCYVFFVDGITVVLTATPDAGMSFSAWSGDGTGLVTRSVLMNGNKVVNAEFSSVPLNDYLIGWYKNDDGSGLFVKNYATNGVLGGGLLPDLDVIGDLDIFWNTEPGFGYSPYPSPYVYAKKDFSSRSFGNKYGIGIFAKKIENNDTCPTLSLNTLDGSKIFMDISGSETIGEDSVFQELTDSRIEESKLNHWYFFFMDDTNFFKVVKEDGTLLIAPTSLDNKNLFSIISIGLGMTFTNDEGILVPAEGLGGAIGDAIIYNNKDIPISTSGYGYNPWTWWYDLLKSRYGMAARSGW